VLFRSSMIAQLKLVGNPIAPLDATPKQYVDQILPVGVIMMYGGTGAPPGGRWAVCNGAELEVVLYQALYGAIGRNFSPAGTPGGRFNLPNLQGKIPLGSGTSYAVGSTGGSADSAVGAHTHTLAASSTGPSSGHTHVNGAHSHPLSYSTTLDANYRHQHTYISSGTLLRATPQNRSENAELIRLALAEDDAPSIELQAEINPLATLTSGPDNPTHAHDFGGVTQTSGNVPTSGETTPHTHTLSGSTASAGTATAGSNLPPYVAMPYIMRIN